MSFAQEVAFDSWSDFGPLTRESIRVFNEVIRRVSGISYEPHRVSTDNDMSYRFLCAATNSQGTTSWDVLVVVNEPVKGRPRITGVRSLL
ncbi:MULTISPECIES: hypothetical protein [unclassified Thalassolituus]|uniref:hypothetical protein n=1 Tax=unclassified Thalassolituus TaxID=2624967 RepID=UPI000C0A0058|nr:MULTISPECIES: hypothetical protein [unclassified Thalassolituus]MAK91614.1 hypothetical protein [Thalassolituus sp.]MAS23922.1 hypothetical protein [Oceanospirillaceae bacterium]MBL36331.1 hypothetical protein [Oceanospirillaceae bacterium]|tara:strand:- start:132 stop:401 length:270 start_codon:yes stop_codon:yes gene_type:complete